MYQCGRPNVNLSFISISTLVKKGLMIIHSIGTMAKYTGFKMYRGMLGGKVPDPIKFLKTEISVLRYNDRGNRAPRFAIIVL